MKDYNGEEERKWGIGNVKTRRKKEKEGIIEERIKRGRKEIRKGKDG